MYVFSHRRSVPLGSSRVIIPSVRPLFGPWIVLSTENAAVKNRAGRLPNVPPTHITPGYRDPPKAYARSLPRSPTHVWASFF